VLRLHFHIIYYIILYKHSGDEQTKELRLVRLLMGNSIPQFRENPTKSTGTATTSLLIDGWTDVTTVEGFFLRLVSKIAKSND
jgi:hypothetical protein